MCVYLCVYVYVYVHIFPRAFGVNQKGMEFTVLLPLQVALCIGSTVAGCQACLLVYSLIFQDRVSLCSTGSPRPCSLDQAGLILTEIHLPQPLECWG